MNSISLANTLRENQNEVIRRWLDNLNGHIAEDFEQMLRTPMGVGVASSLLSHAIEFFEVEEYQRSEILRKVRQVAREASFRRSAVGFSLQDIIYTGLALRRALEETLLNHAISAKIQEEQHLLAGVMSLNLLGDSLILGEIAGYFAFHEYNDNEDDEDREVA